MFWLQWVAATTLGATVGQPLENLVNGASLKGPFDILPAAGGAAVTGLLIGLAQAFVLLRYLKPGASSEWVVGTVLGRVAAAVVAFLYFDTMSGIFLDDSQATICGVLFLRALLGAVLGLLIALPQYFILKPRTEKPIVWLIANAGISALTTYIFIFSEGILYGVLTGIVTGYILVDLLRHPTRYAEWRAGWEQADAL